jgi:peptidoglycan/LPS O-acetylase OafA/YrhL
MLAAGIAAKAVTRAMERSDALAIWNHALPTHADWFAAGMALAVARVLYEDGRFDPRRRWVIASASAALLFAVLCAKLYYQGTLSGLEQQTANAILFAFALGFVALSSPQARAVRWLSWRPVVFLGLASYSLFLIHDPLVRGLRDWGLTFGGASGFVVNLLVVAGVSVLFASACYLYVERPALARKRGWQVGDRAGLGSSAPPAGAVPAAAPVTLVDPPRP